MLNMFQRLYNRHCQSSIHLSDTVWAYKLSTILVCYDLFIAIFMDPSFAYTLNPLIPCLFQLVFFISAEANTTLIFKLITVCQWRSQPFLDGRATVHACNYIIIDNYINTYVCSLSCEHLKVYAHSPS